MQPIFVGRQPIINTRGETFAYELLFRSGETNAYDPSVDGDSATSQVLLNAITEIGIDKITGNSLAFINLTNRFIENPDLLSLLPNDRVVLEILETVKISDEVVDGIRYLKEKGYVIALDDFEMNDEIASLLPYADIIKYDISQYSPEALTEIASNRNGSSTKLLAERVETCEEFDFCNELGFDYFQGYYFAKPSILKGSKIPSDKLTMLHLLSKLNDPGVTIDEISAVLSQDVSLGVRALKFVNSPMSGVPVKVTSIHQAALMLGRDTLRNWVTLSIMADMSEKPVELMQMALTRARFCQLVAAQEKISDDGTFFTVGLISLLDAMMDLEMTTVLENMKASDELYQILINRQGRAGELLSVVNVLEMRSDSSEQTLDECKNLSDVYLEAIVWTNDITQQFT